MAIRPSIYIGLGGTGIMAVSCIKKLFVDAYKGVDNIPGQIAFIAIDFDSAAIYNSNLPADMHDDFLSFSSTAVTSSKTLYGVMNQMRDCSWMFPNNVRFLSPTVSDVVGQVRTSGRFLTEMVQDSIIRRISDCITQIRSIQAKLETDWAGNLPIDIHIAMSLVGGTGSGSFLNVAQLIRERFQNQVHIIGYGVLHSVFRTMDPSGNKTPRVVANAYSAILDLDYLMGASSYNPIQISLNGRRQVLRSPIYDEFYVVDNETEFGERVDHVDELCGVIGLGMYMHSYVMRYLGHLGWKTGLFDIPPKLGWVQGLGACQVVYKGEELAEIYSLKAALNVITNLQNVSLDVDKAAIDWAVENKVREDLNFDQLIDTICDIKKVNINAAPLDVDDSLSEIRQRVERYVKTRPGFKEDKDLKELIQELKKSLRDKVETLISAENGVANTKGFLSSLMKNLTIYLTKMEVGRVLYEKKVADRMPVFATEYKNYEAYSKRLFKSKRTMSTMLEEGIGKVAKDILIDNLEAERRKVAVEIFTVLLTDVNALYDRVKELDNKLFALKKQYKEELVSKQNVDTSLRFFEYDLSAKDRLRMEFEPTKNFYSEFFKSLGSSSILNMDVNEELDKRLLEYCAALPQAKAYRDKLIVDVVEELSPEDYAIFKKNVSEKSSRLLRLDNRGQKVGNSLATAGMVQNYVISIYKNDNSRTTRLESDGTLLPEIKKDFIYSEFDSMKQKMIFYRSDMAIIPYCIAAFDENTVEREYNALLRDAMTTGITSFNPHFDKQIFEAMRKVDFKLKPEMQNEAEFYWVCGNFFGWTDIIETQYIMEKNDKNEAVRIESKENVSHTKYIRCHKGKYQVWNENGMSTGVDGKWVSLGNTNHRGKAFNYFKTIVLPKIKNTLHYRILELLIANGRKGYKLLIQGIIDDGKTDYIDKIACTDKNSLTYCSEQNGEQDRFNKEWEFIVKDLINAIDNFK